MRTLHLFTVLVALVAGGMAAGQERHERDAKIDGTWYLSGDRNQPCYAERRYDDKRREERLVFSNERGEAAYGTVEGRRVRVPAWDDPNAGGLHGQVEDNVILWRNGTYWTRRPIF